MQISAASVTDQLIAAQNAESQTAQQIQFAVAKKQLDAQRQAGDAVQQLIAQALTPLNRSTNGGVDLYA